MIAALIIVFREVFEAGLIIGIVLAVTRQVAHRNRWIGGGVLAGVLLACLVAGFAGALSNLFAGMGQELFNAAILGLAVVMLTWHNVWMARHGSELAGELRSAGQAVVEGSKSLLALAVVVGVAVLREGSEVVLFLYGVLAGGSDTGWSVHGGAGGGLPGKGQLADGDGYRGLGFWLDPVGFQYPRPRAAHPDRVHRPADGDAAHGLSGDFGRDFRADAALRRAGEGGAVSRAKLETQRTRHPCVTASPLSLEVLAVLRRASKDGYSP